VALRIDCPSCHFNGQVPDRYHGKTILCPRCKASLCPGSAEPQTAMPPEAARVPAPALASEPAAQPQAAAVASCQDPPPYVPVLVLEARSGTGNLDRLPDCSIEPSGWQQMPEALPAPAAPILAPAPVPSMAPATGPAQQPPWLRQCVEMLCSHGILNAADAWPAVQAIPLAERGDVQQLARALAQQGKLTWYQAALVSQGKADQLVLGNYVLLDKVGEGGFGSVFKARHRRMQRLVALKLLRAELVREPLALQRFQREVEAAAKLSHPNIVTAYDADEARGMHFLAMEFIDGPDLWRLVKKQGPLPPARAVDYLVQAARGLAHAHAAGIVHRDVKPSNFLLDKCGVVKVSDLGLARVVQPQRGTGPDPLTATCSIMGTVDFMAPEQALNTRTADQQADIYSLGCTLYVLLIARPVYAGATALEVVLAHREQPIPQLPPHCASLQDVFVRMMAKRVEDRYSSMEQVIAALQAKIGPTAALPAGDAGQPATPPPGAIVSPSEGPPLAQPLSCTEPLARPNRKGNVLWFVGGVAAAVILLAIAGLMALTGRSKTDVVRGAGTSDTGSLAVLASERRVDPPPATKPAPPPVQPPEQPQPVEKPQPREKPPEEMPNQDKCRIAVVSLRGFWTPEQWERYAPKVRALADSPNAKMNVTDAGNTKWVDLWPVRDFKACMKKVTFGTIGADYGVGGFLIHVDPNK